MWVPFVPWINSITGCFFAAPGGDAQLPSASEASSPGAPAGRVIEFYVPAIFQLPERRWVPAEERGKLIEFSASSVKKSA